MGDHGFPSLPSSSLTLIFDAQMGVITALATSVAAAAAFLALL